MNYREDVAHAAPRPGRRSRATFSGAAAIGAADCAVAA